MALSEHHNLTGIPLFDGINYNNWYYRLETHLDEKDLVKFIKEDLNTLLEKTVGEDAKNKLQTDEKKCKSIIVKSTHDSQLECIKGKETAKEMIDTLASIFQRKSISS